MNDMELQHPIITHMIQTGTPDGKPERWPICPICVLECERIYVNMMGEIVGCDNCIEDHSAWDHPECLPDE